MAIEAVIFDFGGVFTTSPVENFAAYERQHGLPEKFLGGVIKENHHRNAWARFERAEINAGEFDALFAAETKAAGHEVPGRVLIGLMAVSFRQEMIAALLRVKGSGLKTGCITNTLPGMEDGAVIADAARRREVAEIQANFDHIIESSKAGVRKPEPRIYEMMCEALAVAPPACAFLDDLGINLKPARDLGMHTIKVPLGDVRPAIRELEALLNIPLS
jgi:putative hydrolase of the HAD superfamily